MGEWQLMCAELNLTRLGGSAHRIVTKTVHKTILRDDGI